MCSEIDFEPKINDRKQTGNKSQHYFYRRLQQFTFVRDKKQE
jgi:hypothetical protein